MKATRPDGGYVFHGGCDGCTQPLRVCPSCCYMEANWGLPSRNPVHAGHEKENAKMILKAKMAARLKLVAHDE